jgi:hypothetical protein
LFSIKLTQDKAIHFEDIEFTADHSNNLSLATKGDNSGIVAWGMARNGSPSLHAILEESPSEDNSTSSEGESSAFPVPRICNAVISAIPIATTLRLEETSAPQTIPVRP